MRGSQGVGVLATTVLVSMVFSAAGRAQEIRPPMQQRERYQIGGDLSRYESLYGKPEFRAIDEEMGRPWPKMQNIRTVAILMSAQPGDPAAAAASAGRVVEYSTSYATHLLCGQRYCLGVRPVEEMADVFAAEGRTWFYRPVEVIGAVDNVGDPRDPSCPCYAFRVWSAHVVADSDRPRGAPGSDLETLVRNPVAAAGKTITVHGTFRGANLFSDLPPETRRQPSDWVLKDGAFSIWVTGRPAAGKGFSLDPSSRSDCDWEVEVLGKVETAGGYLYLRAKSVALVRRARPEP